MVLIVISMCKKRVCKWMQRGCLIFKRETTWLKHFKYLNTSSKDASASVVSITRSTISQCLWAWCSVYENEKTSMHTQIPSDSPISAPDGPPPIHPFLSPTPSPQSAQHHPFHHLNPNEAALSGFKRRPVRVISRSKFKWTVCVSIGCQRNASFYIMSPRRVVFLLLEIHFRGPVGVPWQWGLDGCRSWKFRVNFQAIVLTVSSSSIVQKNGVPFLKTGNNTWSAF